MRKSLDATALLVGAVLVLGLGACGSDEPEVAPGQSGKPPLTVEVTTETTVAETTPTTLAEEVVEVPDISDLGLEWDEEPIVDETTGIANMAAFNQYLFDDAPNAMVPEGTFDELEEDDLETAVDEALGMAPRKTAALFLGVTPDDVDVQMLAGSGGSPESARIIVIINTPDDDSVAAIRWEFRIQMQDKGGLVVAEEETEEAEEGQGGEAVEEETGGAESEAEDDGSTVEETEEETGPKEFVSIVYSAERTFQCMPGRGHLDFTAELCA
jgi:hypothetical protein